MLLLRGAPLLITLMIIWAPLPGLAQSPDASSREGVRLVYERPEPGLLSTLMSRIVGGNEFGSSYALVIGVGNYEADWSNLEAPVSDALKVTEFLITEALFDYVVTLTNEEATKENICTLMEEEFPSVIGDGDRFLFYFSGHGTQREVRDGTLGYLVLSNCESRSYAQMLDMNLIASWDKLLGEAQHVLFVLDCCFSGLAGTQRMSPLAERKLERLSERAHHLVTAGSRDEESVASLSKWGGSLFTNAFLRAARGEGDLASPEYAADGVVSLMEIMVFVNDRIDDELSRLGGVKMSPQITDLRHDNKGEFFFLLPENGVLSHEPVIETTRPQRPKLFGEDSLWTHVFVETVFVEIEPKGEWRPLDLPPGSDTSTSSRLISNEAKREYNKGIEAKLDGDLSEARASFEKAIEYAPDYTDAFLQLGVIQHAQGEHRSAYNSFYNALILDSTDISAMFNLGMTAYTLGAYGEAKQRMMRVVELQPDDAESHNGLATVLYRLKEWKQAAVHYQRSSELDPTNANTLFRLARCYRALGDDLAAAAMYREAVNIDPDFADAHFNLGNILTDLGDYAGAAEAYQGAINADPGMCKAYYNQAIAYQGMENWDDCLNGYQNFIRLCSANEKLATQVQSATRAVEQIKDFLGQFE